MINDNYAPVVQPGNGTVNTFTGTWPPISASYFQVYFMDNTTKVQTLQLASTYTLTSTSSGWQVVFTVAPPASVTVIFARNVTLDQGVPYSTTRGYQGASLETSLDKLTAEVQGLRDVANRSITLPLGSTTQPTLGTNNNLGVLYWNGSTIASDGPTIGSIAAASTNAAAAAAAASAAAGSAASAISAANSAAASASAASNKYAGVVAYNANTTLNNTASGFLVSWYGTYGNLTMPLVSTMIAGAKINFENQGIYPVSILFQGSDSAYGAGGTNVTSIIIQAGETLELTAAPYANTWLITDGTASLQFTTSYKSNPNVIGRSSSADNAQFINWSRGTTIAVPTSSEIYTADRHIFGTVGGAATVNQANVIGFALNSMQITGGTGMTGFPHYRYRLPGAICQKYVGRQLTFQIRVWNASTGAPLTTGLEVNYANSLDNFNSVTQIVNASVNGIMQTVPTGVAMPVNCTFQVPVGGGNGLDFVVYFPAANMNSNTKYFYLADLIICPTDGVPSGSGNITITPDFKSPALDIMDCQYYLPSFKWPSINSYIVTGQAVSGTSALFTIKFPVPVRVPPTTIVTSGIGNFKVSNATGSGITATGINFVSSSTTEITFTVTVASGLSGATYLVTNAVNQYMYFLGADL